MKLETERLILRYLKDDDVESIFNNYANDDRVTKFLLWPTHKTIEDTKKVFDIWKNEDEIIKKYHYFMILKETNELIGSCAVASMEDGVPEIGIVLGYKYWNKGLMTEACNKLIEQLFKDGYKKLYMKADANNIGSNRVIQKCGFKYTGTVQMFYKKKGNIEYTCNTYELKKPGNI